MTNLREPEWFEAIASNYLRESVTSPREAPGASAQTGTKPARCYP
jgi:hypothetical protein